MECSCCGSDQDPLALTALPHRPEVEVCHGCIDWLQEQTGALDVTPTLPVVDMADSVRFYETIGFGVRRSAGDGFAFVDHDGASVFDLGLEADLDPARNRTSCFVLTRDVDDWHARLAALGLDLTAIEDQKYGMREFTLTDPSGNRLRFASTL